MIPNNNNNVNNNAINEKIIIKYQKMNFSRLPYPQGHLVLNI